MFFSLKYSFITYIVINQYVAVFCINV